MDKRWTRHPTSKPQERNDAPCLDPRLSAFGFENDARGAVVDAQRTHSGPNASIGAGQSGGTGFSIRWSAAMTTPARGYSWAPFQPGHDLSTKSRAWSPAHVDPRAQQLLEEIAADQEVAFLASPAYVPLLRTWATAVVRMELFGEWLFAKSMDDQMRAPRGGAKAPIEVWFGMAKTVANLSAQLGLTPLARARLGRDFATAQAISGRSLQEWQAKGAEMAARDQEAGK